MDKIRAGVFDDHPFTLKGLSGHLVAEGIELVFSCQNKEQLIRSLDSSEIDVLILDIVAPDVSGIELFEMVSKRYPHIGMIAHTTLTSVMLVENLLSVGVKGYVNKKQDPADIISCIRKVCADEICVPEQYSFLISRYRETNNTILTQREIEVLQLIAKEYTSTEIAKELSLSVYTVENHRKRIFVKLNVKNLAGMIVEASRMGYIS